MDFNSHLATIGQATNQKDKIKGYQDLLAAILEHQDDHATATAHLEQFVTAATEESVGLVVSRQALTDLTAAVEDAAQLPAENKKRVYKHALDKVQGRVVSFEEQVHCPNAFAHACLSCGNYGLMTCYVATFVSYARIGIIHQKQLGEYLRGRGGLGRGCSSAPGHTPGFWTPVWTSLGFLSFFFSPIPQLFSGIFLPQEPV